MSRVGQKPVPIPDGVTVTVEGRQVKVKGKVGELEMTLARGIDAKVDGGNVVVSRPNDNRESKSFQGLMRSLIENMVEGVSAGFKKELEIQGVGYKALLQGNKLSMTLGFARPVEYIVPDGVKVVVEDNTKLTVTGADKQKVGMVAAEIRNYFPAEPYKGKGIRYKDEVVRRKVGKTVA